MLIQKVHFKGTLCKLIIYNVYFLNHKETSAICKAINITDALLIHYTGRGPSHFFINIFCSLHVGHELIVVS